MSEIALEEWACAKIEAHGWISRKMKWVGRRNAMDRFFAKDGRVVLIEFKKPGKKAVGTQAKEIQLFKAAGVECHVCDNPIAALNILGVPYA